MASNYQHALTANEICYLRSCHLTFNIGTGAVRMYFNRTIPPANLQTYLTDNKPALIDLKDDGTINRVLWEKLYPASGGLLFVLKLRKCLVNHQLNNFLISVIYICSQMGGGLSFVLF